MRFGSAETFNVRHGLAADAASAKMRAALETGPKVLIPARAERARLWQIEELRNAHSFKPRGPMLGM